MLLKGNFLRGRVLMTSFYHNQSPLLRGQSLSRSDLNLTLTVSPI